ncbi:MAG: hypothetical protein ACREEK_35835 [Bradyrhizobium sp.]
MLRADYLWWATAIGLAGLLLLTLCFSAFDQRPIGNDAAWVKPIKFQLSLAVHFATLAAIVGRLSEQQRTGRVLFWIAAISIGSAAFEIAYIMIQAARQETSHFNLSTPLYQAMYVLMAIGAVFITVAAAGVGAVAWLDTDASLAFAIRLAIAVGLTGGTLLTLVIAFRMGGALNHHVGIEPAGAARFPLTGWSMSVGDLRVPHFFATHMMQAIPVIGLVADRVLPSPVGIFIVLLASVAWTALTLWLFHQALAGVPLLTPR